MSYTITDFTAGYITVVSDTNKTYSMRVPVTTEGVYITDILLDTFIIDEMTKLDLRAIADAALAVSAGPILALVVKPTVTAPTPTTPDAATVIRAQRARLLSKCDWRMVPDAGFTPEVVATWAAYRQALRDLTLQAGFPTTVTWPVPPSVITGINDEALTNVDGTPTATLSKIAIFKTAQALQ
jgi:hypothetical protein